MKKYLRLLKASVHAKQYEQIIKKYSMEFPTKDALNNYLEEHPKADPSKHKVKKKDTDKKTKSEKSDSEGKSKTKKEKSSKEDFPKYYQYEGQPAIVREGEFPKFIRENKEETIFDVEEFYQSASEITVSTFNKMVKDIK